MVAATETPHDAVERVFALYHWHGHDDYIGEPVTQLEHMWQAAALAQAEGCDDEVVLAAFFHDLGHLCADQAAPSMDGLGAVNHEQLGADYLRRLGFSARLAALVEGHVLAKRYLTHRHPEYLRQLSAASRATLALQGGPMTAAEAAAFEQQSDADLLLRLRRWDDQAKLPNQPVGDLVELREMALRHLQGQLK